MTGLAGSHGPITTFLYRCNPINHQLHPPIPTALPSIQTTAPARARFQPPSLHTRLPETTRPKPLPAPNKRQKVSRRWPRQERWRRQPRHTGNRPKTSMLNNVRLKTWVVDFKREASTVEAINAAFVERLAGNLEAPSPVPVLALPTVVEFIPASLLLLPPGDVVGPRVIAVEEDTDVDPEVEGEEMP